MCGDGNQQATTLGPTIVSLPTRKRKFTRDDGEHEEHLIPQLRGNAWPRKQTMGRRHPRDDDDDGDWSPEGLDRYLRGETRTTVPQSSNAKDKEQANANKQAGPTSSASDASQQRLAPPVPQAHSPEQSQPISKNYTFLCPLTGYPDLVWLKTYNQKLKLVANRALTEALIHDDTVQFILMSNKPEHLAREAIPGNQATLNVLQGKERKWWGMEKAIKDETVEIVVTNVGSPAGMEVPMSRPLIAFVGGMRNWVQQGGLLREQTTAQC